MTAPNLSTEGQEWLKRHRWQHLTDPKSFVGDKPPRHVEDIRRLIEVVGIAEPTVLDYGCGKARCWSNWRDEEGRGLREVLGVGDVTFFDPGFPPFAARPEGKFDIVVCTDVMEHIPEGDVSKVLRDIFGYARKGVFLAISISPSTGWFEDGTNQHATVREPGWWKLRLAEVGTDFLDVDYVAAFMRTNV